MFIETTEIDLGPFPDAKVRITIAGLAYCRLNTANSVIKFLSHVGGHELEMRIYTRERQSGGMIGLPQIHNLNYGPSISIRNSDPMPPVSYKLSPLSAGQFELKEMINLSGLHSRRELQESNAAGVTLPSPLEIENCAFYTHTMTPCNYDVYETGSIPGTPKPVGYVLGGLIKSKSESSDTFITMPHGEIRLPGEDAGMKLVYDIALDNRCSLTPMPGTSDFRHYYESLSDPFKPTLRFTVKPGPDCIKAKGTGIAACNPTIIYPPDS